MEIESGQTQFVSALKSDNDAKISVLDATSGYTLVL